MKHLNIKIYGSVQGVFFRETAKQKAEELNIKGFARNEKDGTVFIEAEGEEKALENFINWCHGGPESAEVEKVETSEGSLQNFKSFNRDFADS